MDGVQWQEPSLRGGHPHELNVEIKSTHARTLTHTDTHTRTRTDYLLPMFTHAQTLSCSRTRKEIGEREREGLKDKFSEFEDFSSVVSVRSLSDHLNRLLSNI